MLPEMINSTYSEKCDIWSIGIILYYMLTKKRTYNAANIEYLFLNIIYDDYD